MIHELYNLIMRFVIVRKQPAMTLANIDLESATVTDIIFGDYPDFSDAYIESMKWKNGNVLKLKKTKCKMQELRKKFLTQKTK